MKKNRLNYSLIVFLIIVIGILSRKISILPLCIGDGLYAVMIYFITRTLFLHLKNLQVAVISLSICILIECSQLYQAEWIIQIRKTLLGHYILGQGFLWSDLIAYVFGITAAFLLDRKSKSVV